MVDVVEVSYRVVSVKQQKYTCRCGGCVETAPGPERATPGSRYSLDFAIKVAIDKYLDHIPLARQERILTSSKTRASLSITTPPNAAFAGPSSAARTTTARSPSAVPRSPPSSTPSSRPRSSAASTRRTTYGKPRSPTLAAKSFFPISSPKPRPPSSRDQRRQDGAPRDVTEHRTVCDVARQNEASASSRSDCPPR